jgi:hypothetical protein
MVDGCLVYLTEKRMCGKILPQRGGTLGKTRNSDAGIVKRQNDASGGKVSLFFARWSQGCYLTCHSGVFCLQGVWDEKH